MKLFVKDYKSLWFFWT